ncbi:MAG TPA: P-loop NTPase fold protein [Kofleriaceae bacterium]
MGIDPNVELLADIPIAGPEEDWLDRGRIADRLIELAVAGPPTAPRVVALTGEPGAGKSSVLRMVTARLAEAPGVALISIDAANHASAAAVNSALVGDLTKLFAQAGVIEATDKIRNTLTSYGGFIASVVRLAGVKVDVAGALERSPEAMRTELAENIEQLGRRIVIVIDHVDRLPLTEVGMVLAAQRLYSALPSVAVVIALDRHGLAVQQARTPAGDPLAFERMVQVELDLPPAPRALLARVMYAGLERIANRTKLDLDVVIPLFDPVGGIAMDLVRTPRDAKRAINALAAAIPLATGTDATAYTLEVMLRVLVPEIDPARLDARHRTTDRAGLLAELTDELAGPRATAATAALRALIP